MIQFGAMPLPQFKMLHLSPGHSVTTCVGSADASRTRRSLWSSCRLRLPGRRTDIGDSRVLLLPRIVRQQPWRLDE